MGLEGLSKIALQRYEPPGPIGSAYIKSHAPIPIIMGPAGSGKTIASIFKAPYLAGNWFPLCKDGTIRVKIAVIRNTLREIHRTTLPSWHEMFPPDHPFTMPNGYSAGQDRPAFHKLKFFTIRNGKKHDVILEMEFNGIGDIEVERFARGYQVSAVWLNECDTLHERIPGLMLSRTGRYPPISEIDMDSYKEMMGPYQQEMLARGVKFDENDEDDVLLPRILWGDCNPPDISNWVCRFTGLGDIEDKNPMYELFRQPSGLSANAENRKGRTRSSYEFDAQTMTKQDARRFVYGLPGYAKDGTPVYEELFNIDINKADAPLKPVEGLPINIGLDAGGSPACIIGQFMPNGQRRVLREICANPGTGPARFADMIMEILLTDFRAFPISEAYADPSAFYGADRIAGELSWVEIVATALNVNINPAPSNEPALRQEAVRWYLTAMLDANTPRYLVDPRCTQLIGGFMAHYKLTKQATAGATDMLAVVKNKYSHIHDAEQYICLGHRGRYGVIKDAANLGRGKNIIGLNSARRARTDFDVFKI